MIPVTQDIAYGHKLALRAIAKGEAVLKYNCVIGRATCNIRLRPSDGYLRHRSGDLI